MIPYIRFFISFLAFILAAASVYSLDTETETDQPPKPKTYTERYKDFYNPKNYTKNYKERYKPENYRRYYNDLRRENYGSYRYSDSEYDSSYRHTYTEPKPIDEALFNQGRRSNTLPQQPNIPLNDPTPLAPQRLQTMPVPFNPFARRADMIPPHLLKAATGTELVNETADSTTVPENASLPQSQSIREQPAAITDSPTAAVNDPQISQTTPDITETSYNRPSQNKPSQGQTTFPAENHRSPGQLLFDSGLQSFALRNYSKAKSTFANLVEMAPGSVYAQFAYGLSLFFTTDYKNANNAFHSCYRIAEEKRISPPTLWQIQIEPRDFRYHYRKLARYVEQNPHDHDASTLLLTLSNAASNTQPAK